MKKNPMVWMFLGGRKHFADSLARMVSEVLTQANNELFLGYKSEGKIHINLPCIPLSKTASWWPGTQRIGGFVEVIATRKPLTLEQWMSIPKTELFYDTDPFLFVCRGAEKFCVIATTGHESLIYYISDQRFLTKPQLVSLMCELDPSVSYVPHIVKGFGKVCGRS